MTTDQKSLLDLSHAKMPFGKYKDYYLIELPEHYVMWFASKGFPAGKLGDQLRLVQEIKINGLEALVRNIRKQFPKP